jgi:hypothetical protein
MGSLFVIVIQRDGSKEYVTYYGRYCEPILIRPPDKPGLHTLNRLCCNYQNIVSEMLLWLLGLAHMRTFLAGGTSLSWVYMGCKIQPRVNPAVQRCCGWNGCGLGICMGHASAKPRVTVEKIL